MARQNYKFEKRRRDLAKKKKREEKMKRKLNKKETDSTEDSPRSTSENESVEK